MTDDALRTWWMMTASQDFKNMEPKLGEYSSLDLEVMGAVMEGWGISAPDTGSEAACLWYLMGKVSRAVAAYREGRPPSLDTLEDITTYSLMARRIRETGRWP